MVFVAESLGLPLIQPYFPNNGRNNVVAWGQGVNYAVEGATALNASFIKAIANGSPVVNASLETQLTWFKQSLPSNCGNNSDCRSFIGRSLILVGEIGGNDYNHPLSIGKSIDEVESYVPLVIDTIVSVINVRSYLIKKIHVFILLLMYTIATKIYVTLFINTKGKRFFLSTCKHTLLFYIINKSTISIKFYDWEL
ncbi:putative sinapine esterase [Helianthus debilis subsp. tardiflorus]